MQVPVETTLLSTDNEFSNLKTRFFENKAKNIALIAAAKKGVAKNVEAHCDENLALMVEMQSLRNRAANTAFANELLKMILWLQICLGITWKAPQKRVTFLTWAVNLMVENLVKLTFSPDEDDLYFYEILLELAPFIEISEGPRDKINVILGMLAGNGIKTPSANRHFNRARLQLCVLSLRFAMHAGFPAQIKRILENTQKWIESQNLCTISMDTAADALHSMDIAGEILMFRMLECGQKGRTKDNENSIQLLELLNFVNPFLQKNQETIALIQQKYCSNQNLADSIPVFTNALNTIFKHIRLDKTPRTNPDLIVAAGHIPVIVLFVDCMDKLDRAIHPQLNPDQNSNTFPELARFRKEFQRQTDKPLPKLQAPSSKGKNNKKTILVKAEETMEMRYLKEFQNLQTRFFENERNNELLLSLNRKKLGLMHFGRTDTANQELLRHMQSLLEKVLACDPVPDFRKDLQKMIIYLQIWSGIVMDRPKMQTRRQTKFLWPALESLRENPEIRSCSLQEDDAYFYRILCELSILPELIKDPQEIAELASLYVQNFADCPLRDWGTNLAKMQWSCQSLKFALQAENPQAVREIHNNIIHFSQQLEHDFVQSRDNSILKSACQLLIHLEIARVSAFEEQYRDGIKGRLQSDSQSIDKYIKNIAFTNTMLHEQLSEIEKIAHMFLKKPEMNTRKRLDHKKIMVRISEADRLNFKQAMVQATDCLQDIFDMMMPVVLFVSARHGIQRDALDEFVRIACLLKKMTHFSLQQLEMELSTDMAEVRAHVAQKIDFALEAIAQAKDSAPEYACNPQDRDPAEESLPATPENKFIILKNRFMQNIHANELALWAANKNMLPENIAMLEEQNLALLKDLEDFSGSIRNRDFDAGEDQKLVKMIIYLYMCLAVLPNRNPERIQLYGLPAIRMLIKHMPGLDFSGEDNHCFFRILDELTILNTIPGIDQNAGNALENAKLVFGLFQRFGNMKNAYTQWVATKLGCISYQFAVNAGEQDLIEKNTKAMAVIEGRTETPGEMQPDLPALVSALTRAEILLFRLKTRLYDTAMEEAQLEPWIWDSNVSLHKIMTETETIFREHLHADLPHLEIFMQIMDIFNEILNSIFLRFPFDEKIIDIILKNAGLLKTILDSGLNKMRRAGCSPVFEKYYAESSARLEDLGAKLDYLKAARQGSESGNYGLALDIIEGFYNNFKNANENTPFALLDSHQKINIVQKTSMYSAALAWLYQQPHFDNASPDQRLKLIRMMIYLNIVQMTLQANVNPYMEAMLKLLAAFDEQLALQEKSSAESDPVFYKALAGFFCHDISGCAKDASSVVFGNIIFNYARRKSIAKNWEIFSQRARLYLSGFQWIASFKPEEQQLQEKYTRFMQYMEKMHEIGRPKKMTQQLRQELAIRVEVPYIRILLINCEFQREAAKYLPKSELNKRFSIAKSLGYILHMTKISEPFIQKQTPELIAYFKSLYLDTLKVYCQYLTDLLESGDYSEIQESIIRGNQELNPYVQFGQQFFPELKNNLQFLQSQRIIEIIDLRIQENREKCAQISQKFIRNMDQEKRQKAEAEARSKAREEARQEVIDAFPDTSENEGPKLENPENAPSRLDAKMDQLLNDGYEKYLAGGLDTALFYYEKCLHYAMTTHNRSLQKRACDLIAGISTDTLLNDLYLAHSFINKYAECPHIDLNMLGDLLKKIHESKYFKVMHNALHCYRMLENENAHGDYKVSENRRKLEKTMSEINDLVVDLEKNHHKIDALFQRSKARRSKLMKERAVGVGLLKGPVGQFELDILKKKPRSQYIIDGEDIYFFSKWEAEPVLPTLAGKGEAGLLNRLYPANRKLLTLEEELKLTEFTGFYRMGRRWTKNQLEGNDNPENQVGKEDSGQSFLEITNRIQAGFSKLFDNYNNSKKEAADKCDQERLVAIPDCLMPLFASLDLAGKETLLTGGTVRRLIEKDPQFLEHDLDFVIFEADPEKLKRMGFIKSPHIPDLWTARKNINGREVPIDVRVVREKNNQGWWLGEDMKKHDFTNAFYCNLHGYLIPVSEFGLMHLKKKILAANGDPKQILSEDPVRILRAMHFIQDGYQCDAALENALKNYVPGEDFKKHEGHIYAKLRKLMQYQEGRAGAISDFSKAPKSEKDLPGLLIHFGLLEKLLDIPYIENLDKVTEIVKRNIIVYFSQAAEKRHSDHPEKSVRSLRENREEAPEKIICHASKTSERGMFRVKYQEPVILSDPQKAVKASASSFRRESNIST